MNLFRETRARVDDAVSSTVESARSMTATLGEASRALGWVTAAAVAAVVVAVVALAIAVLR